MKLIGLTGGAGSGKSTVAGMFRELGAVVVDADEATHALYAAEQPGFDAVVKEFGRGYIRHGQVDRARLGELVFNDEGARGRLNAIMHPLVRGWMNARTIEAVEQGAEVVIHDVPLLFESGLEKRYPEVVLVYVPEALQLSRLVDGRGVDDERATTMIAVQMPIEEKRALAQHVIDNTGSIEATRKQVAALWALLR